jgi:uncharacterized membrane protein
MALYVVKKERFLGNLLMKVVKLALKRETAIPVLALLFASAVSVALIAGRIIWTGRWSYGFLVWNLGLAWLPLVFSLLACEDYRTGRGRSWAFPGLAAAWLLFFPNAPYIFTDVIHLVTRYYAHFWVDLVLILLCALTGLVLGFLSLYLMQAVVADMLGRLAGWVFIGAVAGLSSFGIYLGRFLRFNSWDVVFKPVEMYRGIGSWAADTFGRPSSVAFPALFATFLFISYLLLYALTQLHPGPVVAATDRND